MKEYIGYSLDSVLSKIGNKKYVIIYNVESKDAKNKMYVTNVVVKDGIYIITVSDFQIEVD